ARRIDTMRTTGQAEPAPLRVVSGIRPTFGMGAAAAARHTRALVRGIQWHLARRRTVRILRELSDETLKDIGRDPRPDPGPCPQSRAPGCRCGVSVVPKINTGFG